MRHESGQKFLGHSFPQHRVRLKDVVGTLTKLIEPPALLVESILGKVLDDLDVLHKTDQVHTGAHSCGRETGGTCSSTMSFLFFFFSFPSMTSTTT